jgi:hypothetical protein
LHRRKCANYDESRCERCYKLELKCIYVATEKPRKPTKPNVPAQKRNKLFEAIWTLKEETDDIQLQLAQLQIKRARAAAAAAAVTTTMNCKCIDPNTCQHIKTLPAINTEQQWGVTITNNKKGTTLHLETDIKSLSDLSKFVQEAYSFFNRNSTMIEQQLSDLEMAGNLILPIRMKTLKVEKLVRNLLGTVAAATVIAENEPVIAEKRNLQLVKEEYVKRDDRQRLKIQIIKHYFNCFGRTNPILVYSYHLPILLNDPDSLLSTSIVSLLTFSKCQHIDLSGYNSFTRDEFAESCRIEAKDKLQEILFESETSLELIISIWSLCCCSIFALKGKEARFQSSICWNMVNELKPRYNKEHSFDAEIWKRLFYVSRYIEFNFHVTYDGATDFSSIKHHLDIDLPLPLANEDEIAALCFRYVAQLTINSAGINQLDKEISNLQLLAGVIDSIDSTTIQYLENTLLYMWKSMPTKLKLGNGPFQFITAESIESCNNPCILRFNVVYYIYWMNLQSRVMKLPEDTDLRGATFHRIDGDRALVIVSICADAATKIFQKMASTFPCIIELNWLTMCIEILKLLSNSGNNTIKNRAKLNLEISIDVLKQQLNLISPQSAPYLDKIKRAIKYYLAVNKICNLL